MTEKELVLDALEKVKRVTNKEPIDIKEIIECIGIVNFLVDHVENEEDSTMLTEVGIDLMLYVVLNR